MSKYIVATTPKRAFEHPYVCSNKNEALRVAREEAYDGNREHSVWVRTFADGYDEVPEGAFTVFYDRIATFDKDGRRLK